MKKPVHFLTGEEFSKEELQDLLRLGNLLKKERQASEFIKPLKDKTLGLIFEKPSLRTRLSFSVAMQELGGFVVETTSATSKHEEPEDVIRVLSGYCHGVMFRTHEHQMLERMVAKATVPVINGLSDTHHPCQVLADLQTLDQAFGKTDGLTLSYIGDGNNMLHSLILLLPVLGINIRYCVPKGFEPQSFIVKKSLARARDYGRKIEFCSTPAEAVKGTDAIYTDVWTSMGFEKESALREKAFKGFQIGEALMKQAPAHAIILHCLPMIRGKEITDFAADHERSHLFKQSENRLHMQKALLTKLLS